MCGIAGIIATRHEVKMEMLTCMGVTMQQRGPDDQGVYLSEDRTTGFVHRRLSIIDLDPRSNQPMWSEDGRFLIILNGEIYNYRTLRGDLEKEGLRFRTTSDTEVVLNLFIQTGPDCLKKLNGMFALAIWDTVARTLFVARDHLGIKPLFYTECGGEFAFASDLKAFEHVPWISRVISSRAVSQFLYFNYVPQPSSIFEGIFKLLPGHYLSLEFGKKPVVTQYWKIMSGRNDLAGASEVELVALFRQHLENAVQSHLVSDVEVGAFLSGGLDSSSIVSFVRTPRLKTFTIGFEGQHNTLDLTRARQLAAHFNLVNIQTTIGEEALDLFQSYLCRMDEPLSEASLVPLLVNFKLAKENGIKVVLTGDGADELLGGYDYFFILRLMRRFAFVPRPFWKATLASTKPLLSLIPFHTKLGKARDLYFERTLRCLNLDTFSKQHQLFVSADNDDAVQHLSVGAEAIIGDSRMDELYGDSLAPDDRTSLAVEMQTALANKHLAKVDKASMANSVEARVPFLDRSLVEFTLSLPDQMRQKKSILRKAMTGILPQIITQDRKRGFNMPMQSWVSRFIVGSERGTAMLNQLSELRFVKPEPTRNLVQEFKVGKVDHSRTIWSLYVLASWLQNNTYDGISTNTDR